MIGSQMQAGPIMPAASNTVVPTYLSDGTNLNRLPQGPSFDIGLSIPQQALDP